MSYMYLFSPQYSNRSTTLPVGFAEQLNPSSETLIAPMGKFGVDLSDRTCLGNKSLGDAGFGRVD